MATNSAIRTKENQDLQRHMRSRLEREKKKQKCSTRQMAFQEGLSIQEGQSLLQSGNQVEEVIFTVPAQPALEAKQHHAVVIVILFGHR